MKLLGVGYEEKTYLINWFELWREESIETYGQTSAKQKSKLVSTAIFWRFLVVEGGGFDVLF